MAHDAQLTVLHVGELVAVYPAIVSRVDPAIVAFPTRAERATRVGEMLRDHARECRPAHVLLTEGDIAPAILETAERLPADVIVMASHHPGPLRRLTRGSVAAAVVRAAHCPVLVVPPSELQPASLSIGQIATAVEAGGERAVSLFGVSRARVRRLDDERVRAEALAAEGAPDVAIVSASSGAATDLLRHAHCPVLFVPSASGTGTLNDSTPHCGGARWS